MSTYTAHYYAHALIVRYGLLPREAAEQVWDECGLHGGDRQSFIDAVEAAHITPDDAGWTGEVLAGADGTDRPGSTPCSPVHRAPAQGPTRDERDER